MGRFALAAGVVGAICSRAMGQDGDLPPLPPVPEIGGKAPALSVEQIVRSEGLESDQPSALGQVPLVGKVVVVEFWATWCAPCIGSIPHLNELVAQFRGSGVVFVSVTDEEREKVEGFLGRRSIDGVVALDTDRSVFLSYRIGAIPRTIVIDANGVIRAMIHPSALTAQLIQAVMEGRDLESAGLSAGSGDGGATASTAQAPASPVAESTRVGTVVVAGDAPAAPTAEVARTPGEVLYEVSVRASAYPSARVEHREGTLVATGCSARDLVAEFCGVSPGVVVSEGGVDLDTARYDATVRLPDDGRSGIPGGRQRTRETLADAVGRTLGIQTAKEQQILPVLVLRPRADRAVSGVRDVSGTEGASSLSWGLGTISAIRQPISVLSERLGAMVRMPVAEETGLGGVYDWTVHCADDSVDAVTAAVEEQLGLRAEVQTRKVEVVVVRKGR